MRQRPLVKLSTLMSRPGWIFDPHHGQLVSWAGEPLPLPVYLPPCSSWIASAAWSVVHDEPGQLGPVGGGGGRGARYLVGGDHHGREPAGLVADARGAVGVEAHAMADAELDAVAVEHGHLLLLGEGERVGLAGGLLVGMALEDRPVVRGLDDQLGLEQPGGVPQLLRLGLAVDEEQGDAPEVVPLPDQPLHLDLGELGVGGPVQTARRQRDRLGDGRALGPLPDDLLVAAGSREVLAAVPVVVAPAGVELEGLGVQADAEGHPEGRREHGLGGRGGALGGTVLDRPAAALRQLVELLGGKLLPLGREHADEVAVADALLVDLLFRPADRAEEILQDHLFQFLPDLRRGGEIAEKAAGHRSAGSLLRNRSGLHRLELPSCSQRGL